jgi:hypothetical protein
MNFYGRLPDDLDPRIPALVDSLTAGLENDYDRAVAIERYLRSFQYTRDLPATADQTSLEYFLFQRRAGHCEYFSTAMAVMLRVAGIRSRSVNGFLGGQWSEFGNYLVVTQNEAHSWVEAWFPGYGWVTFDATPTGVAGSTVEAAWFWPGRIFFDGLQHRWNKWVLDYSVDDQAGLLQRWADLLGGAPEQEQIQSSGTASQGVQAWHVALVLFLLVAGIWWVRRGRAETPPATRMYLQLRDSCERAGLAVTPGLTPLALVSEVQSQRAPAAHPTGRVVDLYLRARYAGTALGESELGEMRQALAAAKKLLRADTRAVDSPA